MEPKTLTKSASLIIKERILPSISALVEIVGELRSEVRQVASRLEDHAARINALERDGETE